MKMSLLSKTPLRTENLHNQSKKLSALCVKNKQKSKI